jgi:hypothetical protein
MTVNSLGLAGDHNKDGVVDAADYVAWMKNPSGCGGGQGYTDFVEDFGDSSGGGSSANGNVPEPAAVMLVALAIVAGGALRRRK